MSLKFWVTLSLIFLLSLTLTVWIDGEIVVEDNAEYRQYHEAFKDAVSDTGVYLAQFEAQQRTEGVRYTKEKNLAIDKDVLRSFYENIAIRFGVQYQPGAIQDIIRHIPSILIVNFDGYQKITLKNSNGELEPVIGDNKPFTLVLDSGDVIFFTLSEEVLYYHRSSNRYIETTIQDLLLFTDLTPITNLESFEKIKQVTIVTEIQSTMEESVRDYNTLMSKMGFDVSFGVPSDYTDFRFSDIGFLAFMQGYPLSNGKTLNSFSFGTSRVSRGKEYNGVVRSDGRHVAYEVSCGVPSDSYLIEVLYGEKEAAMKGYFVSSCEN